MVTVTCPPSRACRPRARYPLLGLQQAGPLRPAHPPSPLASMSSIFSCVILPAPSCGDHAANARDNEFSRAIARARPFFTGTGCPAISRFDNVTLLAVGTRICSPGSPCVKHWWKGAARLQIRALHAIGTASEPPASHAFKPAPYSLPVDVLTVWSAPVNRVQSGCICGPMFSMSMELQRL